ncbi:MAG: fold metallo-hydrolase [Betaproteobacteria bacterium]|nr:fold metallo-hydrolase [Betaproteobacteria bacterium]
MPPIAASSLPAAEGVSHLQLGEVTLSCVIESQGPLLAPFELYPQATPELLESHLHWLAPLFYDRAAKRFVIAIQGFVLRSRGKVIVVDTCVGDCKARVRGEFNTASWGWLARLAAAGVLPEQVDYLVCTHFHVDHVGWNTRLSNGKWVPTFPNARYLFIREEWDFWWSERGDRGRLRTGDYMDDSVLPVAEAGLADFVAMDHRIDEAIAFEPAPGHTPGLVTIGINSGTARAVLASDLLHTPLQCACPHLSTRFCADPELSRTTRLAFLEREAGSGRLVIPAHFPAPSAGIIEQAGEAYRFRYAGDGAD